MRSTPRSSAIAPTPGEPRRSTKLRLYYGQLTVREREVMALVAGGLANKQVAAAASGERSHGQSASRPGDAQDARAFAAGPRAHGRPPGLADRSGDRGDTKVVGVGPPAVQWRRSPAPRILLATALRRLPCPTRPLVAIVDDDEPMRRATSNLLESAGCATATFADARRPSSARADRRGVAAWSRTCACRE